jgi:5-methylthioadenosine/S-adenosylhomocysteine deaminase
MVAESKRFDLGIRCHLLLSMAGGSGEVRSDWFLGIRSGVLDEVGPWIDGRDQECVRFIDAGRRVVMPGLINAHTHLAMSLLRGYEDDLPFHKWLFERVFPVEAQWVDADFVETGVALSALECIRFGTTTVNDMYFFTEAAARVLDRSGLRATLAWPFMDFPVPDEKPLGSAALSSRANRFESFYQLYRDHPRIRPALGPHAPYTCSDDLIREVTALSKRFDVPVHMHVSETEKEVRDSLQRYGKTPGQRLYDLGALHGRFFAAHGVHLTDAEIDLFRETGASVLYNPDSNFKLGSGIAPIVKFRKAGVLCALGTDGSASNNDLSLFGAMDLGTKAQKVAHQDSTAMVALDALRLATYEGARALGLGDQVGSLEPGKRADVILLRTDLPHVMPLYSLLSQLVYAYQGLEVDTVICEGKVLLDEGEFQTLDPRVIYPAVERIRKKLVTQLGFTP